MMKLQKEVEQLRDRFYNCLLLLLASSLLSFSSSFFFVGCHLRGCLACVANGRYKRMHLHWQLAGWVRMRMWMGVGGATRNCPIHFVRWRIRWETNVWKKLHGRCICLWWKLLACLPTSIVCCISHFTIPKRQERKVGIIQAAGLPCCRHQPASKQNFTC